MHLGTQQSVNLPALAASDGEDYYPDECRTSANCVSCVQSTADAVISVVEGLTPEGATRMFRKMYTFAACRQMEHAFVFACCGSSSVPATPFLPELVNITSAA